jgi:hypothetical protein
MDRLQLKCIAFAKAGIKVKNKIEHKQNVRKQATKSSGF